MPAIASLDRTNAKQNPSKAFASPTDIVDEVLLTRAEKLTALENWRRDVLLEMSATSEGMQTCGASERLNRLLREIDVAVRELSEVPTTAA